MSCSQKEEYSYNLLDKFISDKHSEPSQIQNQEFNKKNISRYNCLKIYPALKKKIVMLFFTGYICSSYHISIKKISFKDCS